jgi:hypothetical protein
MERQTEYDGVVAVGEVPVIIRRDSVAEFDHAEAKRAGRGEALAEVAVYVADRIRMAGAYDDVRALEDLQTHLADMIRQA